MYGIIHKATKQYFAGFDSKDNPTWTANKSEAWARDRFLDAKCQAGFLHMFGHGAQQKPVTL